MEELVEGLQIAAGRGSGRVEQERRVSLLDALVGFGHRGSNVAPEFGQELRHRVVDGPIRTKGHP
jgi:hypothetical protein